MSRHCQKRYAVVKRIELDCRKTGANRISGGQGINFMPIYPAVCATLQFSGQDGCAIIVLKQIIAFVAVGRGKNSLTVVAHGDALKTGQNVSS